MSEHESVRPSVTRWRLCMDYAMKPTVRMHYITAGYLAGFTSLGTRHSPFFIHPLDGSPTRQDVPDHVGFEKHYHTVDIPDVAPDHLETVFSEEFETAACALFRTLGANPGRKFETEEELETALKFLSLQAARVPRSKSKYQQLIVNHGVEFMNKLAYSPEFFQEVAALAPRASMFEDSVEQSSLKEAIQSGAIKVVADKTSLAVGILRLTGAIFDRVGLMRCTLWYAEGPDWFVCSDHPAALPYTLSGNPLDDPTALIDPRVELLTDLIFMPLARNVALVLHKELNVPSVQRATSGMVAVVNAATVTLAQRFICSPGPDFICRLPGGRVGNAHETIRCLQELREN